MVNWNTQPWKRTLLAGALAGFMGYAVGSTYNVAYADASCPGGLKPACAACGEDDCVDACHGDYTCDCATTEEGAPNCKDECSNGDSCDT
jgi:hypothetical protein